MKFVLFALVAAIIAMLILTQPKSATPVASPSTGQAPESASTAPPTTPPPTQAPSAPVTREQLVAIRGVVVRAAGGGLVVDCTQASVGAYGSPMILQGGVMRIAGWAPATHALSKVLLKDVPGAAGIANGARINVISLLQPGLYDGMHVVSAQFTLAGSATGSNPNWMNTHSDLDPKPRR